MRERRWELPGRPVPFYDFPLHDREVSTSLFWFCVKCGTRYAEVRAWLDEVPAIWHGVSGCCPTCPGSRWNIPGSLECLTLVSWSVPALVLEYQLSCELSFLSHPDHPYSKELSHV